MTTQDDITVALEGPDWLVVSRVFKDIGPVSLRGRSASRTALQAAIHAGAPAYGKEVMSDV